MAEEREQRAGTPVDGETGDDAAKAAALAESAAADGRDADAEQGEKGERTDWKALALTYKAKVEAANESARRLAEVEEELRAARQSPTPDPQTTTGDAELVQLQRDLMEAEMDAERFKESDPAFARNCRLAATSIKAHIRQAEAQSRAEQRTQQERINDRFIATAEVVGEDGQRRAMTPKERAEFDAFFAKNGAKVFGGIMEAAFDSWDGRRLRERYEGLAAQTRRTRDDETRRTDGVVRTHERTVTAPEVRARKFASEDAFRAEVNRLEQAGDEAAAWALKKARREGRAVVS